MAAAVARGETMADVAARFGVSVANVKKVCARRGVSPRQGGPCFDQIAAEARIAELEAALDELHGASYRLDSGTVAVPIGAWDNAMRVMQRDQPTG